MKIRTTREFVSLILIPRSLRVSRLHKESWSIALELSLKISTITIILLLIFPWKGSKVVINLQRITLEVDKKTWIQDVVQVKKKKQVTFVFPDAVYQSERQPGIFVESSGSDLQSLPGESHLPGNRVRGRYCTGKEFLSLSLKQKQNFVQSFLSVKDFVDNFNLKTNIWRRFTPWLFPVTVTGSWCPPWGRRSWGTPPSWSASPSSSVPAWCSSSSWSRWWASPSTGRIWVNCTDWNSSRSNKTEKCQTLLGKYRGEERTVYTFSVLHPSCFW